MSKSDPKNGIMSMTVAALDVEELEQRLELATAAASCDCCGTNGCVVLVKKAAAAPGEGC